MQRFQRLLDDSPLLSGTIIAFQKSGRRNLPGNRVLEIHRQGDENIVFSGLGEGMQVLQIEIVALIRKNPKRRQALVAILRQIAQEFAIIFPTLESLV